MRKGIMVILDGYGEGIKGKYNPVTNAKTDFLNLLKKFYPTTYLAASGERVGLQAGQMGNSETGHLNIGAGRVVPQFVTSISEKIKAGALNKNTKYNKVLSATVEKKGAVHFIGLLSAMGAHSHTDHLYALIEHAVKAKIGKIYIHVITDGRDTLPDEGKHYIAELEKFIKPYNNVSIATVSGRYFAMDRDKNIDRTEKAFNVMFGNVELSNEVKLEEYICANYEAGVSDEFIIPKRIISNKKYVVGANDCVVMYNFRSDRLRQLLNMCKEKLPNTVSLVTLTSYGEAYSDVLSLFPAHSVENGLTEYLSNNGFKQLKIAETTKFAHVTYFFNGGKEEPFPNEDRILIKGRPATSKYTSPRMRTREITNEAIGAMESNKYDLIVVNYACTDIIGHTAKYRDCVRALKILDLSLQRLTNASQSNGYFQIVTADHGNIEYVRDERNMPFPAHTTNPVMFSIVDSERLDISLRDGGALCDIAPTVLTLMELQPAPQFTGTTLCTINEI